MNYPLISEYIESIKSAEDNFDELSYLRPVLGDDGLPVMTSGNFAVVFKMKDEQSGKLYAVKCFTKEQEGRAEAYREISKELKDVSSAYLVSIQYFEKELFVDTDQTTEAEFPVLLMDWVEGKTLDKYLRENLDDKYALEMLAYRFSQLAQWLIPQPFAHGDLKPDNILVREDDTLVLVDYDGMYVPAMKGQKARELGSPDFRHPQRTEDDFDEHIDDFPVASILLSLKAISLCPQLLDEYGAPDRFLFSENDYKHNYPKVCEKVEKLWFSYDNDLNKCCRIFYHYSFGKMNKSEYSFAMEVPSIITNKATAILFEEWEKRIKGNWPGAYYSNDYRKLMRFYDYIGGTYCGESWEDNTSQCIINEKTHVICDKCFANNNYVRDIKIPQSVHYIGEKAFEGSLLRYIVLPDSICYISKDAFYKCYNLHTIVISPRTYEKFSRLLPNNTQQLFELNLELVKSKLSLYFERNRETGQSYWDSFTSLFDSISRVYGIFEDITCNYHRNDDNTGNIVMVLGKDCDRVGKRQKYYSEIKKVDSLDNLVNTIVNILLDFNGVDILNRIEKTRTAYRVNISHMNFN